MKLRTIALVLSVAFVSAAAHAQTGIYVLGIGQQFTQVGVDNPPISTSSKNTDKVWLGGAAGGVYYDINRLPGIGKLKTGPIVFGVDGRGDVLRVNLYGSQIDRVDGLFSIRVATKKPLPQKYMLNTTPYLQGGFGIGHTRNAFRTYYNNDWIYQFSVGLDRPLSHKYKHLDWRMLEVSGGSLQNYPTGYYALDGGNGVGQSNYMLTFGTGIVFRSR
ncbi:MAG: hypothetical protein ACLQM6_00990 [Acidobacteriaceae bacterium]